MKTIFVIIQILVLYALLVADIPFGSESLIRAIGYLTFGGWFLCDLETYIELKQKNNHEQNTNETNSL